MIRNERGFTLLDMLFVCGLIGVLSCMALPRLLLAKQAAYQSSAIASLRSINSAQLTFALTCGGGFYAPDLTALAAPPPGSTDAFISPDLGVANVVIKSQYTIQVATIAYAGAPASCNGVAAGTASQGFVGVADPTEAGNNRFFAINASSTIWEHTVTLLGIMPEAGDPAAGHPLR